MNKITLTEEIKSIHNTIVSKENFNQFSNKICKKDTDWKYIIKKKYLPKNKEEFEKVTKNWFWVKLSFLKLSRNSYYSWEGISIKIEIKEKEDDYSENEIYKLWEKKYSQYEWLRVLLDWIFWKLYCWWVAGSHYWQFIQKNNYSKIIENFILSYK